MSHSSSIYNVAGFAVTVEIPSVAVANPDIRPEALRVDIISPTLAYRGDALHADAKEDEPVWRISRVAINFNATAASTTLAHGRDSFTNKWSNRAAYDYLPTNE